MLTDEYSVLGQLVLSKILLGGYEKKYIDKPPSPIREIGVQYYCHTPLRQNVIKRTYLTRTVE